jgi:tRNA threonylcarbamoyladenosine biosynthesis protein TsaE
VTSAPARPPSPRGSDRALGIDDQITSPTFTLARQYEGRLRLHHLDVYRFDATAEIHDVGLAELLDDPDAVTVIEWGDAILPALPSDLLELRLTLGDGDDDRNVETATGGATGGRPAAGAGTALAPWLVDESTSDPGAD